MIYLDNSATSFKKPREVYLAMMDCMRNFSANPGRSGHKASILAGEKVFECRQALAQMFNIYDPCDIVFTLNATEGLNLAIKGLLKNGDHAIYSSMEHNSVVRPFSHLKEKGIEYSVAQGDVFGNVSLEAVEKHIKDNTKLIVLTHVSNVCGTINDIRSIGKLAKEKGIVFLVDSAQSAGVLPIDVVKDNIDILAITGHKGLLGPQGTGALYISKNITLSPLKFGGTGSYSKNDFQPEEMPDKYESGTLNTVGICGLKEGINFIKRVGLANIRRHETELTSLLLEDLSVMKNIMVHGYLTSVNRIGVVSISSDKMDCIKIAQKLDKDYDIAVRAGYHCAYKAHQTINTSEEGTVRISIGAFNTKKDIRGAIEAINAIINKK